MSQVMSLRQVEMAEVGSSFQVAMPRCVFLTEEFPRPAQVSVPGVRQRRPRLTRFNTLPVTCGEIQEVEDEGGSPMDEERARRTFLQSLESLRRSTQTLSLGRGRLSSCDTSSLDSVDFDCAP